MDAWLGFSGILSMQIADMRDIILDN